MTEAFPIGNGPMGAMLFGGTVVGRIQFNEISLWSGDRMAVEGRLTRAMIHSRASLPCRVVYGDKSWELKQKQECLNI